MYKFSVLLSLCPILIYPQIFSEKENQIIRLIDTGSYARSFNELQILKENNPSSASYYQLSARLAYAMSSYAEAFTNIYSAVRLSPKNSTNFLIMGNSLRKLGRFAEARNAYTKGMAVDASHGQLYFEMAQLNFLEEKTIEAEYYLKLSQNFNPNSWVNDILAAQLSLSQGDTNTAERLFLKTVETYPQEAPILQELADFYALQKKYDKATAILKEAERRFGDSINRSLQIGDYSFLQGAYKEALSYYSKVKKSFDGKPFSGASLVSWRLYRLYLQNSDTNNAETNLRASFELTPSNQLYISEFTRFLVNNYPPENSYRAVMAKYLDKLSQQEKRKGYSAYYLSLLYKTALIDPFNPAPYKELLNYAKINQDENAISTLLTSLALALPDAKKIEDTIKIRKYLSSTSRLNEAPRKLYAYKTIFFIEDSIHQSSTAFGEEIKFYNSMFPKLNLEVSDKSFALENRSLFRLENYGVVVHVVIGQASMDIDIFDKKGVLINSRTQPYSPNLFTENILSLLKNLSVMLPPIAYLEQRLPNNVFKVGLGAKDGIKADDVLTVYDNNFNPITQLTTVETSPYSATASIIQGKTVSLNDGKGSYVIPFKIEDKINPIRVFILDQKPTFEMDPFSPNNTSLDNLKL